MANNTVAVRLPDEVLEELQKRAALQNKKVSDVVRELIISGLTSPAGGSENNARVIEYLEGFGAVLFGIFTQTVSGRWFSEMATNYAVDMESFIREQKPMDSDAKAALIAKFQEAAGAAAQESWMQLLRLDRQNEPPSQAE